MAGREWSGSQEVRRSILEAVGQLGLQVATDKDPHQISGLLSVDDNAISAPWTVLGFEHYSAFSNGARINDHDAYDIEV
jgi:hypothetical protein